MKQKKKQHSINLMIHIAFPVIQQSTACSYKWPTVQNTALAMYLYIYVHLVQLQPHVLLLIQTALVKAVVCL